MSVSDKATKIKKEIRRIINEAVMADEVMPNEALAILMTIVTTYVAQVEDDAERFALVETIQEQFGNLVEYSRSSSERALALAEAPTETRQ